MKVGSVSICIEIMGIFYTKYYFAISKICFEKFSYHREMLRNILEFEIIINMCQKL